MMHDQYLDNLPVAELSNIAQFERAIVQFRPKLHHYCARMTGSVIDGEDVLQATLIKAFQALTPQLNIVSWEAWLFRIAHNTALDLFREQKKHRAIQQELMMTEEQPPVEKRLLSDNLQQLMVLPPLQRSVIVLRELYGYTSEEIATLLHSSPSAIKSALHRARQTLKQVHTLPYRPSPAALDGQQVARIKHYSQLFNARAFDQIRQLLQDEVKLDMVNKAKMKGRQAVGNYYTNYQQKTDWHSQAGIVDGQPALLVFCEKGSKQPPNYFILLDFDRDKLAAIRDFRYAGYVMKNSQWQRLAT